MSITPEQLAKAGTEHAHQTAFFQWCALNVKRSPGLSWIHAIPNGGERNPIVAGRMKAEGARAGIWDVFMPYPRGKYAGLYIEFKKPGRKNEKNGGLTDDQVLFGEYARTNHYCTAVAYSWIEATEIAIRYLTDGT